jgi:pyridoxal phosphate enzyme (YggS family)
MSIAENITLVKKRIVEAAHRVNRAGDDITIVAVSKTMGIPVIKEALAHGITVIGENRVQEAKQKHAVISRAVTWHMVGHLQTNKVKDALGIFSLIHSLDSLHLAKEIDRRANEPVHCLIEVNTSGEQSKYGIAPQQVLPFYDALKEYNRIVIDGLMTIGPGWATEDPEASRVCFRQLHDLNKDLEQHAGSAFPILSMGMTSDFEVAIEEGSTMVRIGTAIFGPRTKDR